MSGPRIPYKIVYRPDAGHTVAALPAGARLALGEVLKRVAADPHGSGIPYDPKWSPEFRTIPFGEAGLLAYVVSDRLRRILIQDVTWVS